MRVLLAMRVYCCGMRKQDAAYPTLSRRSIPLEDHPALAPYVHTTSLPVTISSRPRLGKRSV
jgi:hypothetical protein